MHIRERRPPARPPLILRITDLTIRPPRATRHCVADLQVLIWYVGDLNSYEQKRQDGESRRGGA